MHIKRDDLYLHTCTTACTVYMVEEQSDNGRVKRVRYFIIFNFWCTVWCTTRWCHSLASLRNEDWKEDWDDDSPMRS